MMKAARYHGKGDIRVDEIPKPEAGPGQVLVGIEWCGICGSDLHEYIMGPGILPTHTPHPLTNETIPLTFGHEFCGRVLQAPEGSSLKQGDAVMVDPRLYCKSCHFCDQGLTNACPKWGFRGLQGGGGGFSEMVAVDEKLCYFLPPSVSLELAALIEPLTVAEHALHVSGVQDFSTKSVLVVGGGPVGFAVCMTLRARGVGKLIVSEPTAKRKSQIAEYCDVVINPMQEHVGDKCRSLTDGLGADIAFDCAGILPGFQAGMDALRYHGLYMNVAGWEKPMIMPQMDFMLKEITVQASMSYTDEDFRRTVETFKAGKYIGIEKMVTSRIALDDVAKKGFEELVTNKDDHIKIMVTPIKN